LFDEPVWTESVQFYTSQIIKNAVNSNSTFEWYMREFITLVAAECNDFGKLKILDFEGGPGTMYADIAAKLPGLDFEYHIVETPANCRIGRNLFPSDPRISFIEANPDNDLQFALQATDYRIVMSSSTLQYSHDWKGLVEKLMQCNAKYFILLRLLSGEMPTFTTIQSVAMSYGPHKGAFCGQIPCTFINRSELINYVMGGGIRCYWICSAEIIRKN
jgi:putative methyltransferase (TIGR04325 family)